MATRKSKPSPARKRTAKGTKPAKKSAAKPTKATKATKKSAAKKSAGKVVKKRTTPRPRRRTGESGPPDGGDKG